MNWITPTGSFIGPTSVFGDFHWPRKVASISNARNGRSGRIRPEVLSMGHFPLSRSSPSSANTTAAEPVLSYELDRLFRAPRRPANGDLSSERAEAGRILLTASGHNGVSSDDRTYLIQQVAAVTGLAPPDAERRVDGVIANAKTALTRSRRSTITLAFSLASSLLLGAAAAWAGAISGGRHRDGAPLPKWMTHANRGIPRRPMAR